MTTPVEAIEAAIAAGILRRTQLLPPVTQETREILSRRYPGTLPPAIDELWRLCSGLDITPELVDFTGLTTRILFGHDVWAHDPFDEPLGFTFEFVSDGAGNGWRIEIARDGAWGAVWFQCHDPSALTISAIDLGTFLSAGFAWVRPRNHVGPERWPDGDNWRVYRQNPFARDAATLIDADDSDLRAFALAAGMEHDIIDLRAGVGGFALEPYVYDSIKRHPTLRIFSAKRRPPKRSWLKRIFGGT